MKFMSIYKIKYKLIFFIVKKLKKYDLIYGL